jgi:hypothetical protein
VGKWRYWVVLGEGMGEGDLVGVTLVKLHILVGCVGGSANTQILKNDG